jgi:nucleotide-binding universal stress UspA family protein
MRTPFNTESTKPLPIRQAIVGMGMESTDDSTLNFLEVLSALLPLESMCFLHVQPVYDLANMMYEREAEAMLSNFDIHTDLLERIKEAISSRFKAVQIMPLVMEGEPLAVLLEQASALNADLLVAGKQTGGVTHGILAGNLVRKTPCGTLIIPDKAKACLQRIMVPIDFSPYSIRALQLAAALYEKSSGRVEIILVHAMEMPSVMAYRLGKTQEALREILELDRRAAMDDFVRNFSPSLIGKVRTELMHDEGKSIAERLLNGAMEHEVDLMVMGAKGHSKVELLLMGSVAEGILQMDEQIPVWVVK